RSDRGRADADLRCILLHRWGRNHDVEPTPRGGHGREWWADAVVSRTDGDTESVRGSDVDTVDAAGRAGGGGVRLRHQRPHRLENAEGTHGGRAAPDPMVWTG